MRILHFSDTHLGYADLDKVNAQGVNAREQDFYDAFAYTIAQAIELKPDLVIHTGDFFHRPSPANRPLIFALEQLTKLSQANIPIVIIAGNHSTPKTIFTSPILQAFRSISGVFPIFQQQYERISFGKLHIHGLPHINDTNIQEQEIERIELIKNEYNILLLHTSLGKNYLMEEYGEQVFSEKHLPLLAQFDYVALGHWHQFQQVSSVKNAWYAGSTERMSDAESKHEKGFCVITIEKNQPVTPTFHAIPTRKWHKVQIENCHTFPSSDIIRQLLAATQTFDLDNAILTIYLKDLAAAFDAALSNRAIQELFPQTFAVNIKRQTLNQAGDTWEHTAAPRIETMQEQFAHFLQSQTQVSEEKKGLFIKKMQQYFHSDQK